MSRIKIYYIIADIFLIAAVLFSVAGCGYYNVKKPPRRYVVKKHLFLSRNAVIDKVKKNYEFFKKMSGRAGITYYYKNTPYDEYGLYKYIKGRYIKFIMLDMYGNVVFFVKVNKLGAVFLNPRKGVVHVLFNKKYDSKINSFKRIFKSLKILLNLDSINKLKNAAIFYNIKNGYFFQSMRKNNSYYIYINRRFLINKITKVNKGKIFETISFQKFIKKQGIYIPLKISIDDYLYNVKINMLLSKGSVVTTNSHNNTIRNNTINKINNR